MTAVLGRVAEIRRFPVKSMAGELLDEADLHWTGFAGDRQYAFVRSGNRSHFPWLTGRQSAEMLRHRAAYAGDPAHGAVLVTSPDGVAHDVFSPALAASVERLAGEPVHLMRIGAGCFDAMPVSLLGAGSLAAIERAHGAGLGALRFRANILLDASQDADDWAGQVLAIGAARVRADWAIPRCAMIAIDPTTAERDPSALRTVAQRFGNRAGMYAAVVAPGRVRVGDVVTLV